MMKIIPTLLSVLLLVPTTHAQANLRGAAPADIMTERREQQTCTPIRLPKGDTIRLVVAPGEEHGGKVVRMASQKEFDVRYRLEVRGRGQLDEAIKKGKGGSYNFQVKHENDSLSSGYYTYKLWSYTRQKWIRHRIFEGQSNGNNEKDVLRGDNEADQLMIQGCEEDGKFLIKLSNEKKYFRVTSGSKFVNPVGENDVSRATYFTFEEVP